MYRRPMCRRLCPANQWASHRRGPVRRHRLAPHRGPLARCRRRILPGQAVRLNRSERRRGPARLNHPMFSRLGRAAPLPQLSTCRRVMAPGQPPRPALAPRPPATARLAPRPPVMGLPPAPTGLPQAHTVRLPAPTDRRRRLTVRPRRTRPQRHHLHPRRNVPSGSSWVPLS
jgi:hypothetical protein